MGWCDVMSGCMCGVPASAALPTRFTARQAKRTGLDWRKTPFGSQPAGDAGTFDGRAEGCAASLLCCSWKVDTRSVRNCESSFKENNAQP
jgi:hypothetical protein